MAKYHIIPVTPFEQNCTIFWDEAIGRGGIVDPGGDMERIQAFLNAQGIVLDKILVTHGHLDHAGAVAALAKTYGLPIIGPHIDDKFWIDSMAGQAAQFGFPETEGFEADQWLMGGETINVAGIDFEVIHCPGHTPGHVVFYQPQDQVAMVGDVLFKGSIGRTDFPKGDYQQLIDSITQKLWPLGDEVSFIPGHGPGSTFGFERKTNPFVSDMVVG